MPPEKMLRVYFFQKWYALSEPTAEDTLYDSDAMCRFAGIEVSDDRIPDVTIILNFGHLLETHRLADAIFVELNAHLTETRISLRSGTLVDGKVAKAMHSSENRNSIDAPASTKNEVRPVPPRRLDLEH